MGAYLIVVMELIHDTVKWTSLTEPGTTWQFRQKKVLFIYLLNLKWLLEVGTVVDQVTQAIGRLHQKNIVHGDLRRNNILVTKSILSNNILSHTNTFKVAPI